MKHLLNGAALTAALTIATTGWAQNPSGGNAMGMPGSNPGGPGLTTYSSGQTQSSAAAPARHRHARHATHATRRGPQLTGSTADQLNREEVARLQAGNLSNPAAPPAPGMAPPPPGPHQMGHVMGPKASGGGRALGEPGSGHIPAGQP